MSSGNLGHQLTGNLLKLTYKSYLRQQYGLIGAKVANKLVFCLVGSFKAIPTGKKDRSAKL